MHGNIKVQMQRGIDCASCAVVFITERYMNKVAGKDDKGEKDNCLFEFNHIIETKDRSRIIAVVMEPRCRNQSSWFGLIQSLRSQLYVDFTSDDAGRAEAAAADIARMLRKQVHMTVSERIHALRGSAEHIIAPVRVDISPIQPVTAIETKQTTSATTVPLASLSDRQAGILISRIIKTDVTEHFDIAIDGEILEAIESVDDVTGLFKITYNLAPIHARLLLKKLQEYKSQGVDDALMNIINTIEDVAVVMPLLESVCVRNDIDSWAQLQSKAQAGSQVAAAAQIYVYTRTWIKLAPHDLNKASEIASKISAWLSSTAADVAFCAWVRGVCYDNGIGVAKDEAEAVRWYRKAADQGLALAQVSLGCCYGNGEGVVQDEEEAVRWYLKAAEQGDARAMNDVGACYQYGSGVAKDEAEAVRWYRKAAEQGYADAQFSLGYCYEHGSGVAKDMTEAARWYRKAGDHGNTFAQRNLGIFYECGTGVAKDDAEAVRWNRKAADQRDADAQFSLGVCYENGTGVTQDEAEALHWYRNAADQGDARAMSNLGRCYQNGSGVATDEAEAVRWYREAAEQGYTESQFRLGVCYQHGTGIGKDEAEAERWLQKAKGDE